MLVNRSKATQYTPSRSYPRPPNRSLLNARASFILQMVDGLAADSNMDSTGSADRVWRYCNAWHGSGRWRTPMALLFAEYKSSRWSSTYSAQRVWKSFDSMNTRLVTHAIDVPWLCIWTQASVPSCWRMPALFLPNQYATTLKNCHSANSPLSKAPW